MKLLSLARTRSPECRRLLTRAKEIERYYLRNGDLGDFIYEQSYLSEPLQHELSNGLIVQPYEYGYYDDDHLSLAKSLHYPLDTLYKLYDKLLTDPSINSLPIYIRQHLIYDVYYPRYLSSYLAYLLRYRLKPSALSPAIYEPWRPSVPILFRMIRGLKNDHT